MYKEEYTQPAFANALATIDGHSHYETGMTLLDYFAAKAMQTICADIESHRVNIYGLDAATIASVSYDVAAYMMEERKKYLQQPK